MESGHGRSVHVAIVDEPIDLERLVAEVSETGCGAILTFLGTVRDRHHGRAVLRLEYSAYEEMAVSELRAIAVEVRERWPVRRIAIVHRIGTLEIGEVSIAIVLSLPHRKEGFAALEHAIDTIKERVPIWKKEHFSDGSAGWVRGS